MDSWIFSSFSSRISNDASGKSRDSEAGDEGALIMYSPWDLNREPKESKLPHTQSQILTPSSHACNANWPLDYLINVGKIEVEPTGSGVVDSKGLGLRLLSQCLQGTSW